MEKLSRAVSEYMQNHRNEIIADLFDLVRIPSIAQLGEGDHPFGKNVDDVLNAAAEKFQKSGVPMTVYHDRGYALGECPGEGDGIGIFAHADVVPVNDDWIKTTPFDPVEENGVLYGRGVNDNKSGIVGALYALRALKACGVELNNRITVYIGGNEESGMRDMDAYLKHERMPEVSVVPDATFPVGRGEKGILRVDCRSKQPLKDIVRFNGGNAYNVVLDHVDIMLSNGESFSVDGLTSHAAHPAGSVNAAGKAAEKLLTMSVCEADKEILRSLVQIVGTYYGENLGIASEGVFGKLTCANGITYVDDDGHLVFTLDIRYGTEVAGDALVEKLTASASEYGFTVSVKDNRGGFLLDEENPYLQLMLDTCRKFYNEPDAQSRLLSGGTYARKLKNAISIDNAFGKLEGVILPKGHGAAHQSDEAINVNALLNGIACLAVIIARLDEQLSEDK